MLRRLGNGWWSRAGSLGLVAGALLAATIAAFVLEEYAGLADASAVYLLAVALVAYRVGSGAAIATAIGAFLTYNFLFLPPRFTFQVADPQHLLTLAVLLVIGVAIGRLGGTLRDQAEAAARSEREARTLFSVSREIAAAKRTRDALPSVVAQLAAEARMSRVWVGLGASPLVEHHEADTDASTAPPAPGPHSVLRRRPGDDQPEWLRLSPPGPPSPTRSPRRPVFRIALSDGTEPIGSLWAEREASLGPPSTEETRLLAAAADQVGQGILRDRLADRATELEVARRSDDLKAALLDSVSHDLRTPLAAIRATAGALSDPVLVLSPPDREQMAREIDGEAERLARLVDELLDMSRIEGGALRSRLEAVPLPEMVRVAVQRAAPGLGRRVVEVDLGDDLPPVSADDVLLSQVLANLLENIGLHTDPDARVRISARAEDDAVCLRVEDGGAGVPADALPRLFDKFYRVTERRPSARRGTGLGLSVVKGMVEAMGGSVAASTSVLGGLAVDVHLPVAAEVPP